MSRRVPLSGYFSDFRPDKTQFHDVAAHRVVSAFADHVGDSASPFVLPERSHALAFFAHLELTYDQLRLPHHASFRISFSLGLRVLTLDFPGAFVESVCCASVNLKYEASISAPDVQSR